MIHVMTSREVATILHALRTLQDGPSNERDACEHFESCTPMDHAEIDALCESINFNGVCFGKGSPDDSQKLAAVRTSSDRLRTLHMGALCPRIRTLDSSSRLKESMDLGNQRSCASWRNISKLEVRP